MSKQPKETNGKLWPTLAGRLNQPRVSELEALEQAVRNGDILTDAGKKRLAKLRKEAQN